VGQVERNHDWEATHGDPLELFQSLDEVLSVCVPDFGNVAQFHEYTVRTSGGSLARPSAGELADAAAALGGELRMVTVVYAPHGGLIIGPQRRVSLWASPSFLGGVDAALWVTGPDETEAVGFFETTRNRLDAVIQERHSVDDPADRSRLASLRLRFGWLDATLRHPVVSSVVSGLIVAGILAGIVALSS